MSERITIYEPYRIDKRSSLGTLEDLFIRAIERGYVGEQQLYSEWGFSPASQFTDLVELHRKKVKSTETFTYGCSPQSLVYSARDLSTNQKVVIKAIQPPFQRRVRWNLSELIDFAPGYRNDKNSLHAFFRELKILLSLQHPSIVQINTLVLLEQEDQLLPGFVMPQLEKLPVPLPKHLISRVALHGAEVVDFLHDRVPIEHRDIKPSNLMLSGDRIVVIDFGGAEYYGLPAEEHQWNNFPRINTDDYSDMGNYEFSPASLEYRRQADLFSLAVTTLALASNSGLLYNDPSNPNYYQQDGRTYPFDLGLLQGDPHVDRFLKIALHSDRSQRFQNGQQLVEVFMNDIYPLLR